MDSYCGSKLSCQCVGMGFRGSIVDLRSRRWQVSGVGLYSLSVYVVSIGTNINSSFTDLALLLSRLAGFGRVFVFLCPWSSKRTALSSRGSAPA